jgi:hypothetical protein
MLARAPPKAKSTALASTTRPAILPNKEASLRDESTACTCAGAATEVSYPFGALRGTFIIYGPCLLLTDPMA